MPIKKVKTAPGNPWGCVGKKHYSTEAGAKKNEFRDRFGAVQAYRCGNCGGWHIGHKKHHRRKYGRR